MEYLQNGVTLHIPKGCFPMSTDSMLLCDFVKAPRQAHVLDLGAGCATLGLLLCADDPHCQVTGIEIDPLAHEAALENIARNGLTDRLSSICCDLRAFSGEQYDLCISNPPYYSGGPASRLTPLARRDDNCTLEELFAAADRCTKFGGDFCLVHKPENLAHICTLASTHHFEPKRLRLVRHREGGDITLILLSCRKGGKPGLKIDEVTLFSKEGSPTEYYKGVYHLP